jgi:multidrug efflux system membrane fusion protein
MPHDHRQPPQRYQRRVLLIAVAMLAAVGAAVLWHWSATHGSTKAVAAPQPVQVSVAAVARRDMPVYVSGLGAVQASVNVTIHSQVDGVLQEVLFTEGQRVKKDDVLAKIDPRLFQAALDQATAKKAQVEAQLIAAQKDLVRFTTLGPKGFATQQSIDQQQGKVDQLKGSIGADAAAIETAQTQLAYTTIVAPSDGRIGVRLVDPGNIVHASDQTPIATLVQTQPISVMFTLPAQLLDDVRAAMQRGPVAVTAFDADNRKPLATGTLLLIDNTIDQATATMRLKATFANEDGALWPGEFVNARVLVNTLNSALVIPSIAVQRGPNGLFAWVVGVDGTARMRPIEAGPASGDQTIVTSGLAADDRVVTDGQYRLRQGATVTVATPPASGARRPA